MVDRVMLSALHVISSEC